MNMQLSPKMKSSRKRSGFTLIEMLVVIVILGILAMIIVPQITASTDDARLTTLQTNLGAMRSSVEVYYAQHSSAYPGHVVPATKPVDVTTREETFVAQLTRYTDINGNVSNVKDVAYRFGPYVKGNSLPTNPFNDLTTVVIDNTEDDITIKASGGTAGWKFYSLTGVLMADDGAHDAD